MKITEVSILERIKSVPKRRNTKVKQYDKACIVEPEKELQTLEIKEPKEELQTLKTKETLETDTQLLNPISPAPEVFPEEYVDDFNDEEIEESSETVNDFLNSL